MGQGTKSTFMKDPINSIFAHLGKILDTASPSEAVDVLITIGIAYSAYRIAEKREWDAFNTILGALIAYRLVLSPSLTSSTAGLVILAELGLSALPFENLMGGFEEAVEKWKEVIKLPPLPPLPPRI